MCTEELRDATASDFEAIITLNDAEVQQTSPLNLEPPQSLVQTAAYCSVAAVDGRIAAFLIALRDDAACEDLNYTWFSSRFHRFLFVDRIVDDEQFTGRRIGSKLHDDVFACARRNGM